MRCLSVLPLALALLVPSTEAHASGCVLGSFNSSDPAINCEVVVHQYKLHGFPAPKLHVMRDGLMVDIAGTVTTQQTTLPVEYPETDCDENVIRTDVRDEAYDVHRVTINGGFVGEALFVDGFPAGHIQAAAASCVEPETPRPVCGHLPLDCDLGPKDDGGGGCNSGRGGAGIVLAGLALLFARKRR